MLDEVLMRSLLEQEITIQTAEKGFKLGKVHSHRHSWATKIIHATTIFIKSDPNRKAEDWDLLAEFLTKMLVFGKCHLFDFS